MKDDQNPISLIADFDGDLDSLFNQVKINDSSLPVIPLRNIVLFPGIVIPVSIERSFSLDVILKAQKTDSYLGLLYQKDPNTDEPKKEDFYNIGTIAKIMRIIELPNNHITVLLQGFSRFNIEDVRKTKTYKATITLLTEETKLPSRDYEITALLDTCKDLTTKLLKMDPDGREDIVFAIRNITNPIFMLNYICTNINISVKEKIDLLCTDVLKERIYKLIKVLNREIEFANIKASIHKKTHEDIDLQQKEYFLQQQIRNIQDELGDSPFEQDIEELQEKAESKDMPSEIRLAFEKELNKLKRTNVQSPDYNVQMNYLQTILNLPWNYYSEDNLDINHASRILNRDHYGVEKVKERILEYLAVIQQRGDFKAPILCLYGPPGIGKTSLGKSIASAMNRKYVRISLGGVHDESEIRGHRRTYIGAMPGRIIKSLMRCGTSNPVFVLDEIDKISHNSINGDPSSALLEVLDPEQNNAFHDNFLDLDYDLSKVLFIATANDISAVPTPLRDRMELIEMNGYITEEKYEIAKRHLIPKAEKENGLKKGDITITKQAIEQLIEQYTRESGVRQLEKKINEIFRKQIFYRATIGVFKSYKMKPDNVNEILGKQLFTRDIYQGNNYAGVVTGLAWTAVGGEILFIETSLSKGKGSKLTLTGNLGDVMKESAMLALEYIKAHAQPFNIDYRIFNNYNIHIHVPEGAVPKDGPSAGITMITSIVSALTQRKVRDKLAMTGEITLRGKVLPVGGIKEKILAAKRAGIETIILCKENKKDIDDIQAKYLEGLTFIYVEDISEVLKIALLDEKVNNEMIFTFDKDEEDKNK